MLCDAYHVIYEFAKLRAFRAFAPYVPSRLRALYALRAFVHYVPSCITCLHLTRLRPLRALIKALYTRFARLFQVLCAPDLCDLKSFLDRFVVQLKLPIFQGLLKRLQNVLLLCGLKNRSENF